MCIIPVLLSRFSAPPWLVLFPPCSSPGGSHLPHTFPLVLAALAALNCPMREGFVNSFGYPLPIHSPRIY
jgi:hypothetical protein